MRDRLADSIDDLINVRGATQITVELDDRSARKLADDLRWCQRSRAPESTYTGKVRGSKTNKP